jgi:ATPase subunit of ABC transporter with duplicated ATPase domains
VVVSHDERFLESLALTHRLDWHAQGWIASS